MPPILIASILRNQNRTTRTRIVIFIKINFPMTIFNSNMALYYYERSILRMLGEIGEAFSAKGFFSLEEISFMNMVISGLPSADARKLLFRLLSRRKADWLRADRLIYEEIVDLEGAMQQLLDKNLLEEANHLTDRVTVLSLEEIRQILRQLFKVTCSQIPSKRNEAMACLLQHFTSSSAKRQGLLTKGGVLVECKENAVVCKAVDKIIGKVVRIVPKIREIFEEFEYLYSLCSSPFASSSDPSSNTAVRVELAQLKFPQYIIVRSPGGMFPSRVAYEEYRESVKLTEQLDSQLDTQVFEELIDQIERRWMMRMEENYLTEDISMGRPFFMRRFTAGWVETRALGSTIVSWYEKSGQFEHAIDLLERLLGQIYYCCGRRGRWWERLAINKASHLRDKVGACDVLSRALSDPLINWEADLFSLRKRLEKLKNDQKPAKSKNQIPEVHIFADPAYPGEAGRKLIYICPCSGRPCSVERMVLGWFQKGNFAKDATEDLSESYFSWKGWHCEGNFFTSLFALLFWDILFPANPSMAVPDAFQGPHQRAPLDLGTEAFYPARKVLIDARIQEIKDGGLSYLEAQMRHVYERNFGTSCVGMIWADQTMDDPFNPANFSKQDFEIDPELDYLDDYTEAPFSLDNLAIVAKGMGVEAICRVLEILARHYAPAGMPDLILWRRHRENGSVQVRLVEVKSPRDRLSDVQAMWAAVLCNAGLDIVVGRVRGTKVKPDTEVNHDSESSDEQDVIIL